MAKMIPIKPIKTKSNGEVKVFNMFKDKLSDEWIVRHSYRKKNDPDENEIDFVLIHRDIGALAVEVKGGGVHLEQGEWYTIDRYGETEEIQDPYTQVGNNKKNLYKELNELKDDKIINTSYVVIFPDVNRANLETTLDNLSQKTLFKDDMNIINLEERLKEIANEQIKQYTSCNDRRLGEKTFKKLEDYFNHTFSVKYSERDLYIETKESFIRLTKEQENIAKGLLKNKKVSINAPAGTGKTVIGVYRAIYGLNNNEKVLYLCHSNNTKKDLRENINIGENTKNIDICTFEYFLIDDYNEYSSIESIGRWNCIIIDDAQELSEEIIEYIKIFNPEYLYILYEPNQIMNQYLLDMNLYHLNLECEFTLYKNIRNTNQVTELAYKLINKNCEEYKNGEDGDYPKITFIKDKDNLPDQLEKYINMLDTSNIYKYNEILILTTEDIEMSDIGCDVDDEISHLDAYNSGYDFKRPFTDRCEYKKAKSLMCTICSAFYTKTINQSIGIEKPYIILVDEKNCITYDILKDDNTESKLIKSMIYTGVSRSTYKVTIILNYKNDEECKNLSDILGIEYEVYDTFEDYMDNVKIKSKYS